MHFAQDVTITGVAGGAAPVLTGLDIGTSSGLTFSNLEIFVDPAGEARPISIGSSQDIHLDKLNIHGSLDGNPQNDTTAMRILSSSDVSITNSEFQQLSNAIGHEHDHGLVISGNTFHDITTDGIHGGGSINVTIANNSFTNFYPRTGDHPDAIQFWTTNTSTSAHDITITGNQFIRGAGQRIQGIFFNDEVGGLPYTHVKISDNLIAGSMYHAITVLHGADVTIDNNIVAGFTDMKSWIDLEHTDGAVVKDNLATYFKPTTTDTGLTYTNNTQIPLASDGGAAAKAIWDARHAPPPTTPPSPTSGADSLTGGAGADTINGGNGADTLLGAAGSDVLAGGADNDRLLGGDGADQLNGNRGNDVADGGAGADTVLGAAGEDTLTGGDGNDYLSGDDGTDVLTGGAGADIFHSYGTALNDRVTDFHQSEGDQVRLDAGTSYTLAQHGADTVISMAGGSTLTLAGVAMSSLTPGWIAIG